MLIDNWGIHLNDQRFHINVFAMAGLIVEMLFMLFPVYNRLKISEYKAYWLTDFLLIKIWVDQKVNSDNHSFF